MNCYIHGAATVCPCDPVYATEAEAKDAEIARLREALEYASEKLHQCRELASRPSVYDAATLGYKYACKALEGE